MNISEVTTRVTPTPSPTPKGSDRPGENPPSLYALAACLVRLFVVENQ
jgi:hypothetical protein